MMYALVTLLSLSAQAATPVAQIDQTYVECIGAAKGDSARAACLNTALPVLQQSMAEVFGALTSALDGDPDTKETANLLRAAHAAYPPSRDADCRLRVKVIEGDEQIFRECVYASDKARLPLYERFLNLVAE